MIYMLSLTSFSLICIGDALTTVRSALYILSLSHLPALYFYFFLGQCTTVEQELLPPVGKVVVPHLMTSSTTSRLYSTSRVLTSLRVH